MRFKEGNQDMSQSDPIVIVSAKRTAIGNLGGALSSVSAHELGSIAIQAALSDAGISAEEIDEVIMGQVLAAGVGQNPARSGTIANSPGHLACVFSK
jgi:acetyl-CoA C-acetyltransferase